VLLGRNVLPVLVVAAVVAGVVLVFPLLAAGSGGLSPSESGVTTSAESSSPRTGVVRMGEDGDPVAPETTPGAPGTTAGAPPAEGPAATTPEETPEGSPTVPGSASAGAPEAESSSAGSSSAESSSAGSSSPEATPAGSAPAESPSASSPVPSSAGSSPAPSSAGSPSGGPPSAGSPSAGAAPAGSASAGSPSAGTTTRAPQPAPAAPAEAARTAATPAASGPEAAVLDLVNQARGQAGCEAVTADPALAGVARAHSADMRDRGYFSHTTPEGLSPFDRAGAAGISYARAENIAYGQRDAAAVMDAWMNSAGHRANIVDCSLTKLGVGVAEGPGGPWWTQLFG
jgi:uncharacterized protein YkwD